MAAGYNSLSVTKSGSKVNWSFNATAVSSAYYFVKVECNGLSAEAEGQGNTASVQITGSADRGPAGSRTYTVKQYVRAGYGYEWVEEDSTTVTVSWTADTYTVSYDANGGTASSLPGNQTKTYGVALTLSTTRPTRASASAGSYRVSFDGNGGSVSPAYRDAARTTSYSFSHWNTAYNGSGTSYNPGGSYTANAAATLYAIWNSNTTTAAIALPTPTRTGHTFKGWATSSTATSGVTGSYTPSDDVTLHAIWQANSYRVTFDPGDGAVTPTAKDVTYGQQYGDLPTPTRGGYSFQGWFTSGGTQITKTSTVSITAAQTLYARWSAKSVTVTFNAGEGTVTPATQTVTYGQTYGTLPTPVRSGYTFLGWFTSATGGTEITASTTVTQTADQTLFAHWESAAILRIVSSGAVAVATQIYAVSSGTVTQVTEVYTVENGVVKRGI